MRDLVYEANGVTYKTKAEAPANAVVKLVESSSDHARYNAERVAKLRAKLRERA
jgi:hypothetical protein